MRAPWHALQTDLSRSTTTLGFQKHFGALRQASPLLRDLPDPAALFDLLHTPGGDPAARNAVLAALVDAARQPGDGARAAVTLLILALWPGLDAVHRRLSRHYRREPEALVAEIAARVTHGIHDLDQARVTWIAATLIRNTERDIRRGLRGAWAETARQDPLPDDGMTGPRHPPSMLGLPDGLDQDAAACLLVDRLHGLLGADAALVVAVAVQGERHHEAAERLGIAPEAARKRYQRALKRLRPAFEDFA